MSYRTILVHVDNSTSAAARIKVAAKLAESADAHLVGTAATGIPRYMYSGSPFDMSGNLVAEYLRFASKHADEALARFSELTAHLGVRSVEARRCDEDEYQGLAMQARYADLLVIGQANPNDHGEGGLLLRLPEQLVLNCGRPVLIVPYAGDFLTVGQKPLVAWNGSVEAARAVTAALPLLRGARQVTVALFNATAGGKAHGEEPGADIAQYLARHDVQVDVQSYPAPADAGDAMLSLAASTGADLLVMGAYGHTRLRESILGGATRTILSSMTLPVLMVH
jgi:nucleotide-binding universal stress UspA family protein